MDARSMPSQHMHPSCHAPSLSPCTYRHVRLLEERKQALADLGLTTIGDERLVTPLLRQLAPRDDRRQLALGMGQRVVAREHLKRNEKLWLLVQVRQDLLVALVRLARDRVDDRVEEVTEVGQLGHGVRGGGWKRGVRERGCWR